MLPDVDAETSLMRAIELESDRAVLKEAERQVRRRRWEEDVGRFFSLSVGDGRKSWGGGPTIGVVCVESLCGEMSGLASSAGGSRQD